VKIGESVVVFGVGGVGLNVVQFASLRLISADQQGAGHVRSGSAGRVLVKVATS
jgi:Zn-dependent alcohol dehydrogenase